MVAKIVLGIGTSHTPMFTLEAKDWKHRANADYANTALNMSDGRMLSYAQLLAEVGPRYVTESTPEALKQKSDATEVALDALADALDAAAPDIVLIVGDDQGEMYKPGNQPAISIYHADDLMTSDAFGKDDSPEWERTMGRGYMMDEVHTVRGSEKFALELIDGLIERHVDVATVARVEHEAEAGLGHAYGFIVKRLFRGREIPIVPIMLNTYYRPNVPTAARCFDIGAALRDIVEKSSSDLRVAFVASGGLSHFVVDEELDRRVLKAFEEKDVKTLRSIPPQSLNSGSSEILNWVMVAGALLDFKVNSSVYIPITRTSAGTGVGTAFITWVPRD
jgi:Catalytic LigB subunit of aromatic ring-opening dioxygenase